MNSTSTKERIIGSLSRQSVETLIVKIFASSQPTSRNTDRDRVISLATLLDVQNRVRRDVVLTTLFPSQAPEVAQTNLRAFRSRLSKLALKNTGVRLELVEDRETNRLASERWCHFEGPDAEVMNAEKQAGSGIYREQNRYEPQTAIALDSQGKPKRKIRYFVSLAHKDDSEVKKLLAALEPLLKGARDYEFEQWQDEMLFVGNDWNAQIQEAIKQCDFGLLLVSPAFFASDYITKSELPKFVANDGGGEGLKRAVPISLKQVPLDNTIDTKGVEKRQIFVDSRQKSFADCRTENDRDKFALELFKKLIALLAKTLLPISLNEKNSNDITSGTSRTATENPESLHDRLNGAERFARNGRDQPLANYEPQCAIQSNLSRHLPGTIDKVLESKAPNLAIDLLMQWACDNTQAPYMALLAELGIGKTTTCKELKTRLLQRHAAGELVPVPIYLDLRWVVALAKRATTNYEALKELLDPAKLFELLLGQSQGGDASPLSILELKNLLRKKQLLLIVDSLDEVLVQLGKAEATSFVSSLYRFLPIDEHSAQPRGKMLIACRTHYFPTVGAQNSALLQQDRGNVRSEDYLALMLLPFTPEKVRNYLRNSLPYVTEARLDDIEALFASIHNLQELSSRPLNLWLLTEQIPELERLKLEGRAISSVDIYENLVSRWLGRDEEKHQISATLKPVLMQYLAIALWRSGQRSWHISQLDQWLVEFKDQNKAFALHTVDKAIELLKEDLRNSTFVVRDTESDDFRFAHTSLQEYFIACALENSLGAKNTFTFELDPSMIWSSQIFNDEILGFLGERFAALTNAQLNIAMESLRTLLVSGTPEVQTQILTYCLLASRRGWPAPALAGVRFANLKLQGYKFQGTPTSAFNLRNTVWINVRLSESVWRYVDLTDAIFVECGMPMSRFEYIHLNRSNLMTSDLTGSDFFRCDLTEAKFENLTFSGVDLIECQNSVELATNPSKGQTAKVRIGHSDFVRSVTCSPLGEYIASASYDTTIKLWSIKTGRSDATLNGHTSGVTSVVYAPLGDRLASASLDRTIRLWNLKTGRCEAILRGHTDSINSVSFSANGMQLASASSDKTIKIWDVRNTECKATLQGVSLFTCISFSPDGLYVASGSTDSSIGLWDVQSGECTGTLLGHDSSVTSASYSPDGSQLASGSWDKTIKLWDLSSKKCVSTLNEHENGVMSVAYARDGTQLASGSVDMTVKIWDLKTLRCKSTLRGHKDIVSNVAYSNDCAQLISSSHDKTIKLWDLENVRCKKTFRGNWQKLGYRSYAWTETKFASSHFEAKIGLWNATNTKSESIANLYGYRVSSIAFSPNSEQIAAGLSDKSVLLQNLTEGSDQVRLIGHHNLAVALSYSPNGLRLASGSSDNSIKIWNVKNRNCESTMLGHTASVNSIAYSPDGQHLASGSSDRTIRLWDVKKGSCKTIFEGHEGQISQVIFSPNGLQVASCASDKNIKVWNVNSGNCETTISGHSQWVTALAYSLDSHHIASASNDKEVKLWNLKTGLCEAILKGLGGTISGLKFGDSIEDLTIFSSVGIAAYTKYRLAKSIYIFNSLKGHEIGHCSIDETTGKFLEISGSAWRYARWHVPSPNTAEGCEGTDDLWLPPNGLIT
jgi:WD40 repeat protein